jgi:hypothetical protein
LPTLRVTGVSERPQKKVMANNAYLAKHAPIVRERMKTAGVRLGAILNTIFKDPLVFAESETLESKTTQGRD